MRFLDNPLKQPRVPLSCRPKGCAGCPRGGLRVGSRGPEDSPFVIVGESPGTTELAQGYPFVGASGKMLKEVLVDVGWDPVKDPEPYITNALQCYPGKDKSIPQSQADARTCQERLLNELKAHPRKVILCLGGPAGWSVTNDFGIKTTIHRGRRWDTPLAEMGAVVTVHPAFLMRPTGQHFFHKWKSDLQYAVDLLHGEDTRAGWKPPTWSTIEDRVQYAGLVERLGHAKAIGGDIETNGLNPWKHYLLSLGVTSDLVRGRHVDIIPQSVLWENEDLTRQLLGLPAKWIWHGGKFDVKFFRVEGISEARVDEDTMIQSYVLDEHKGHDLDSVAYDQIYAPKHKNALDPYLKHLPKAQRDYSKVPKPVLYLYQALDISKMFKMWEVMTEKIAQDVRLERLYREVLIPANEMLTEVELKGMQFRPEQVAINLANVQAELDDVEKHIQAYALKYVGFEVNINSPKQLQDLLWRRMKLCPNPEESTAEERLIHWERVNPHPIFLHLRKWRRLAKQKNTYILPSTSHWHKKSNSKKLEWREGA